MTPPELELSSFPDGLARVLNAHGLWRACRLALSTARRPRDAALPIALREVTDAREYRIGDCGSQQLLAERLELMVCT